ncbi:MAG: site-specific integrase [Gemmataceae bacterium]
MFRSPRVPAYRLHKRSGQAVVTLTDPAGRRQDVYLGKHDTPQSRAEYARVITLWIAQGQHLPDQGGPEGDVTVNELIERFWKHAEVYYRPQDGKPAGEQMEFKMALRPLKFLFGHLPARDIGPKRLDAVRTLLINGYEHPEFGVQRALCRGVVNHRIARIKMCFKWGVQQELVPGSVYHALQAVAGLRKGHCQARETEPVKPVPRAFVDATIEKAPPVIADMIRLQLATGMRSGELIVMRAIDIDTTGAVWLYKPEKHKTAHHGHRRVIPIGGKGQEILRRYLKADLYAPLFSPSDGERSRYWSLRIKRKTPVQPSQRNRRKLQPKRKSGDRYTVESYRRAITRAAKKANVPHWHPHQLRHTRATEIRRQFNIDAAKAVLGHRSAAITEVYAELDQALAVEVMAEIG